ncbi:MULTISPECIES: outer membrane protein assembly factor BamC [Massilia]|uniref:Outer membrane protein assembly factor BamC n=1 Tax=Massilia haematophila TaxID=457923 RepID=A0ABV7PIS0_9BURK|nr:outer membrane protein assembly factor BamC [Massilia sp.]
MTTRNKKTLATRVSAPTAARVLVLSALALNMAACTTVFESDKVDYKSSKKAPPLDVPPDLTQLQKDNRYATPDKSGVATASGFQQSQAAGAGSVPSAQAAGTAAGSIGPISTEAVRVERAGDQRWLVVKQTPEQLWPQVRQFWEDAGFGLASESPATGVMETEWAENRSKIPQDFLRSTIGKVFDRAYSTGERDKYRTRLERLPDGSTEIYISHRGAEEVLTGAQKETTVWTVRPNDPTLEAQFLGRLVARLTGATAPEQVQAAQAKVEGAAPAPQRAKLVGDHVEVDEGFDRAWRRVGLALDRVGFTVEDRDRVQGVYFVRYVDLDAKSKDGFFKRLFTFGEDEKAKEAQRYRVLVKGLENGNSSVVTVQDNEGKADASPTAAKILSLLNDELK